MGTSQVTGDVRVEGVGDYRDQHEQFLRRFMGSEPHIRAYVRRLLPSRMDVDDLMQDIAVVLWGKFGQYRSGADFRAWAFGVARFEVLAWVRDHARNRRVLAGDVLELIADESAASEMVLSEQRLALENCLAKLPPDQRDILLYAHQPETSMTEAAARSGRSKVGFYQWIYRLRHSLLDCIRREVAREAAL